MREVGIDISGQHSKGLESIPLAKIQRIITLCGEAAEHCPPLPKKAEHIHWPLPDPALVQGDEERVRQACRDVRDAIRSQVQKLFSIPTGQSTSPSQLN
jgi:arsenate reductase